MKVADPGAPAALRAEGRDTSTCWSGHIGATRGLSACPQAVPVTLMLLDTLAWRLLP